jgi:HDOD domain
MLNQAIDRVTDHSWIPSSAWRRLGLLPQKKFARKKSDLLDHIPVMSATVLGLEILLHEPCIDLRMASELVLSDVGATIQILRLIGREYEFATEHPCRMGDCLASLDAGNWFDAISARTFACDRKHTATSALWKHCRLVAQYARLVAESLESISPEEAYLVGLLHDIGAISKVLSWPNNSLDDREPASLLAIEGSLPLFVLSAIRSMNDRCSFSPWKIVLTSAHELAEARPDFDPTSSQDFNSLPISPRGRECSPIFAHSMLARS